MFALKAKFIFVLDGKSADYIITGSWSAKAAKEVNRSFNLLKVPQKSISVGIMLFWGQVNLNCKSKICGTGSFWQICFSLTSGSDEK